MNINIGTRAFSVHVAAPTLWNMLPSSIRFVENIAKFRRHSTKYIYNVNDLSTIAAWHITQCVDYWNVY